MKHVSLEIAKFHLKIEKTKTSMLTVQCDKNSGKTFVRIVETLDSIKKKKNRART